MTNSTNTDVTFGGAWWNREVAKQEDANSTAPADKWIKITTPNHPRNKQSFRYWAENNPEELHQRLLCSPQVTVWCAMAEFCIWGLYLFEENTVTVSVASGRHCEMLETFVGQKLNNFHYMIRGWFQHYGATTHTSQRSMEILRDIFPDHLISLRGDIACPSRLPDLNPCDYFLWGYLKSKVYNNGPHSIEQLRQTIRQEATAILQEMTRRVVENFKNDFNRLQQCMADNGSNLTDLIFKMW